MSRRDFPSGDYDAPWEAPSEPEPEAAESSPRGFESHRFEPAVAPIPVPATPGPQADSGMLQPPKIFTPVRWLLALITLFAVLPLWAAHSRGIGLGYESGWRLREGASVAETTVMALNGSFAYSEATGFFLTLAVLVFAGGRVERCFGSGVLAAAFVLGGWVLNLFRLEFEAGQHSLVTISGGWPAAALVLGLCLATPGRKLWLFSLGFLLLAGGSGESAAPVVLALGALLVGYGGGRGLTPSNSAQPTARGCLLLFVTVSLVCTLELSAIVRDVRMPDFFAPSRPLDPEDLGPLEEHGLAKLRLALDLPQGWHVDEEGENKNSVLVRGSNGELARIYRWEAHPFNRDPDTFLLYHVLRQVDSTKDYYEDTEFLEEGPLEGKLGPGYVVGQLCSLRFSDVGPRPGVRRAYAFFDEEDAIFVDCFLQAHGRDDPVGYARRVFDSIAKTVRLGSEEDPK